MIVIACFVSLYTIIVRNMGYGTADWALEVPITLVSWATFIGIGANLAFGSHIKTDFFLKKLSKKIQKVVLILTYFLLLFISVLIVYYGIIAVELFIKTDYKLYEMFYTPFYLVFLILPASASIWCFHILIRIFNVYFSSEEKGTFGQ